MNKTFTTIALIAVLGTLAVSCQKEDSVNPTCLVAESNDTVYTVCYSVDGTSHTITLVGDKAWHDFLDHLFALAEEGHTVSFRNVEAAASVTPSKETITHSTYDKDDAYKWAEEMGDKGYAVTIRYDEETKKYTCCAIK